MPNVHTDASWLTACTYAVRQLGGKNGSVKEGKCEIQWATNGRKAKWQAALRFNPSSDLHVFYQVWVWLQYRPVVDYMRPWVAMSDKLNIIDAGANVGFTTLYLKSQFPSANIVSLEPESSNYIQLKSNVAANNLQEITLLNAGLWQREAYLEVGRDFGDHREWSFYVKEVAEPTDLRGYDVPTLMKQMQWTRVDLLKIDIEGAERYLFTDDNSALNTLRNVRFLAIEIHDVYPIREKICKYLEQYGFDFFDKGELTIGRNRNMASQ